MNDLKRRGRIVDHADRPHPVPRHGAGPQVLTELAPWRFQASQDQVIQGFTQAWLADAPDTTLGLWARQIEEETGR